MERPRYEDGMGTIFSGKLVDPLTRRQVLSCEACGEPVWLAPSPCIVSTMCEYCVTHCAGCGVELEWVEENASELHSGRCLCDACWETVPEGGLSDV